MSNIRFGLILLAISICFILNRSRYVEADETPDLYSAADNVVRLNSTTFIPTVFHQNKNTTYMVQFYNTFCGHCQMFAPIYKELATRVKNWTSVIRLAGVDCAKDENMNTCSDNKIEGYPTILLFPPNARVQDPKDAPLNLRSLQIKWTIDDIEESIIDYIANLSMTNRQYPLVVNALQPVNIHDLKHYQRLYPSDDKHDEVIGGTHNVQDLMFVVESEKSYLGRKLIVEYFRIHSKLELRRIPLSNTVLLKSILHNEDFAKLDDDQPVLLRLNPGDSKAQVLVRGEAKHILPSSEENEREDFIQNRFKMFFEHFYSVELKDYENTSGPRPQVNARSTKRPAAGNNDIGHKRVEELEIQYLIHNDSVGSTRLFAIDLLKGISYMLTHEIPIKGNLRPEEFTTVRNLLTILKKYLPLDEWDSSVSKLIDDLRTRLDSDRHNYEKNGLSTQQLRDILELSGADAVRLRYKRENWMSCSDSDRQRKGYTCSLWLLFHALTVGEYSKAAPVRFRPTLVLFTMRDYITKFLGCTVCSSNFEKETESLDQNLNSRNSSVLWLWYTHNRVNQRLNNEKSTSDRKPLIDVLFPAHDRCPKCIKGQASDVGLDGKTLEDIQWNLPIVLDYLVDLYRPERIVSPKEMASLLNDVRGKINYDLMGVNSHRKLGVDMNRSVEQWNLFSTSDISLCLVLYLLCIVIVAIVCVALNPRWKRFKTK